MIQDLGHPWTQTTAASFYRWSFQPGPNPQKKFQHGILPPGFELLISTGSRPSNLYIPWFPTHFVKALPWLVEVIGFELTANLLYTSNHLHACIQQTEGGQLFSRTRVWTLDPGLERRRASKQLTLHWLWKSIHWKTRRRCQWGRIQNQRLLIVSFNVFYNTL